MNIRSDTAKNSFLIFIILVILFSCERNKVISKEKYISFVLSKVESIQTSKKVKCTFSQEKFNKVCYGVNLTLFDLAQALRKVMYNDYKNPPFWQPTAGAYSGQEWADNIIIKNDLSKHFAVIYTPVTPEHVQEEVEMGSDMSEVKNFKAYLTFLFVTDQK
jgi:hypothetical protein